MAILIAAPAVQATERDVLLEEVRGLRRDLHAVAVVAQRIQLLVYRTHVQAEVTRRAKEKYDGAAQHAVYLDRELARTSGLIKNVAEALRSESDRGKKQALEHQLEYLQAEHQSYAESLPKAQTEDADARREWEMGQAKLEALQARMDQLERQLEGLSATLAR